MVRIDKKIREVVNQIKEEEAKIATLSVKLTVMPGPKF